MTISNPVDAASERLKQTFSPDTFLGFINWYSISETSVRTTLDDFNAVCEAEGLESRVRGPRVVDVFKRACKTAEERYVPTPKELADLGYGDGVHHFNYMVRSAGSDSDSVWRILVREVVDRQDHTLDHVQIAKLTFRRAGNMLVGWETSPTDHERALIDEVVRYFAEETQTLTTNAVRNFITNTVERDQMGIRVRATGGVYFVRNQFTEQLDALERVVKKIGGDFHSHPLIDDSKQREMVRIAFEAEAKADIDSVMAEMVEISKSGKNISKNKWMDLNNEYEHYRRKIREFSDILDASLTNSAAWLEVMKEQVDSLLDQVATS